MACEICKKPYVASSENNGFDSDGKPHVCNTCGKSFSLKIQLKRHMQSHESGLPYICNACEKQDNQVHNVKLSKKSVFSCEICQQTFNSKRLLLKHDCEHKLKVMHYDDFDDDDSFEDTIAATKRLKDCLQTKSKRTPSKSKTRKLDISVSPYQCSDCSKSFTQFRTYEKHRQTHKVFKCVSCNAGFTSKEGLQNHHSSGSCNFKFNSNGSLDKTDDRKHICEFCGKSFARKSTLEGHMATHLMEKNYSEAEDDSDADADFSCDYKGNTPIEQPKELCLPKLKIRRSFTCEICLKFCVSKKSLEKHLISHQNLTPEPAVEEAQKSEDKKKVEGKKIYVCRICNETFPIKEEYKKHKLSHSPKILDGSKHEEKEKKTYTCKVCSKVFHKKKHLKKHFKAHSLKANERRLKMPSSNTDGQLFKTHSSNKDGQPFKTHSSNTDGQPFKTHPSNIDDGQDSDSVDIVESRKNRQRQKKRNKDFACKVCGKRFAGERCMIKHEAKHAGNVTESSLSSERKGKRPKTLICEYCCEDFTGRRHAYVKHKLSHTPEVCGICDVRFVDRSSLREHLKTHIGTEEARRFLECSQKVMNAKHNLQNPDAKVEYIYLVLR